MIILTSNLGTADLRRAEVGFAPAQNTASYEPMKARVLDKLNRQFRPELLNRLDDVIVFQALPGGGHRDHRSDAPAHPPAAPKPGPRPGGPPGSKNHIANKGYDPALRARPLRRAIQHLVEDPRSERILWKEFHASEHVVVDAEADHLVLRSEKPQRAEADPVLPRR